MQMSQNNLFLSPEKGDKEAYISMMESTVRAIADAVDHGQAYAGMGPYELRAAVHAEELLPEKGHSFEEILDEVKEKILPNLVRPMSTNYMAHLHSAALLETIAAELILSTFNQSMDSWDQAPVATEIEVEVVRHLCKLYGYDGNGDGVFTSGGSQSNLSGLLLARDWFCNTKLNWDIKKYGLPENFRKFRMYASEISHFSMEKSAHLMGLGYDAVAKIPVDDNMRMDMKALKEQIRQDVEKGFLPFCACATVGTTDFGSIDPMQEMRALCDEYGMWLHADAAYGSGVVLSEKYAHRVAGLAACDSICGFPQDVSHAHQLQRFSYQRQEQLRSPDAACRLPQP